MDEMTRALQPSFFGYLPESRRVRAFFRYFQGWCSLVAQQHAVEIAVHVDWLGAAKTTQSTGGPPALADDYRIGLMDYQRGVELALLNVSRMEARIIEELTMAAEVLIASFTMVAVTRLNRATPARSARETK